MPRLSAVGIPFLQEGEDVKKPSTPTDPAGSGQDWPRTLNEAVDRLARMLSHTEKEEIAALTEGDLIGLHFGPGMRIRNEFSLWHDNSDLLMNCQGIKYGDAADSYLSIDPDDASMMIIRVLWARLRH